MTVGMTAEAAYVTIAADLSERTGVFVSTDLVQQVLTRDDDHTLRQETPSQHLLRKKITEEAERYPVLGANA